MVPWQIVRYGAASELLGLSVAAQLPLLGTLGESLLDSTRVVLGSDLATLGIETTVDPIAHPFVIPRTVVAIEQISGPEAAEWWRTHADSANRFVAGVIQQPRGVSYTLAYDTTGRQDVLVASGLPAAIAAELTTRLGELAEHLERVTFDQSQGQQRTRFDVTTTNVDDVMRVLEASRIQPAQMNYLRDTMPVWTLGQPEITVRVAAHDNSLLDQVGIVFRDIPGEQLARVWRTFRPSADGAQRIGAVVGALGTEIAERLEIRCYRTESPRLDATFVPVDSKFTHTVRA